MTPKGADIERVCSSCFDDADIQRWIRSNHGKRGCDACKHYDSPTVDFSDLCAYLKRCLSSFWGQAIEQLPYDGREGGYQGNTWTTEELVFDSLMLELPRDKNDDLYSAFMRNFSDDEIWCDFDWLRLDEDDALRTSWEHFCETIKHERRFFFQNKGGSSEDPDAHSSEELLSWISSSAERFGLIRSIAAGTSLWRARANISAGDPLGPSTFGPPPPELAVQSNRMNPPGIPMFYAAERACTAVREIHSQKAKVGQFRLTRDARILDLTALPEIPGVFSNPDRITRLALVFLHHFAKAIMQPVARDDRAHIEYIPSQVVTEYFREFKFNDEPIDGIRYPSAVDSRGRNVVLFIDSVVPKKSIFAGLPSSPLLLAYAGWKRALA